MEKVFPLLKQKPPTFQEGFCLVFGSEVRGTKDVLDIVEDCRKLMWHAKRNGKVITREDIYLIRGKSVLFVRKDGNHHWPPSYRKKNGMIIMPIDFHKGWHNVNFSLWKRKDLRIYWKTILANEVPDNCYVVSELAQWVAREKAL